MDRRIACRTRTRIFSVGTGAPQAPAPHAPVPQPLANNPDPNFNVNHLPPANEVFEQKSNYLGFDPNFNPMDTIKKKDDNPHEGEDDLPF